MISHYTYMISHYSYMISHYITSTAAPLTQDLHAADPVGKSAQS